MNVENKKRRWKREKGCEWHGWSCTLSHQRNLITSVRWSLGCLVLWLLTFITNVINVTICQGLKLIRVTEHLLIWEILHSYFREYYHLRYRFPSCESLFVPFLPLMNKNIVGYIRTHPILKWMDVKVDWTKIIITRLLQHSLSSSSSCNVFFRFHPFGCLYS